MLLLNTDFRFPTDAVTLGKNSPPTAVRRFHYFALDRNQAEFTAVPCSASELSHRTSPDVIASPMPLGTLVRDAATNVTEAINRTVVARALPLVVPSRSGASRSECTRT